MGFGLARGDRDAERSAMPKRPAAFTVSFARWRLRWLAFGLLFLCGALALPGSVVVYRGAAALPVATFAGAVVFAGLPLALVLHFASVAREVSLEADCIVAQGARIAFADVRAVEARGGALVVRGSGARIVIPGKAPRADELLRRLGACLPEPAGIGRFRFVPAVPQLWLWVGAVAVVSLFSSLAQHDWQRVATDVLMLALVAGLLLLSTRHAVSRFEPACNGLRLTLVRGEPVVLTDPGAIRMFGIGFIVDGTSYQIPHGADVRVLLRWLGGQ